MGDSSFLSSLLLLLLHSRGQSCSHSLAHMAYDSSTLSSVLLSNLQSKGQSCFHSLAHMARGTSSSFSLLSRSVLVSYNKYLFPLFSLPVQNKFLSVFLLKILQKKKRKRK